MFTTTYQRIKIYSTVQIKKDIYFENIYMNNIYRTNYFDFRTCDPIFVVAIITRTYLLEMLAKTTKF